MFRLLPNTKLNNTVLRSFRGHLIECIEFGKYNFAYNTLGDKMLQFQSYFVKTRNMVFAHSSPGLLSSLVFPSNNKFRSYLH